MAEGIFTQEALRVYFIADSVSIPFLFVSGRLAGGWRIGLLSGGETHGSPKGARKSGGLDFEAEGRCAEVQKERESALVNKK